MGSVDKNAEAPLEEPPTGNGGVVEDVVGGGEETTEGEPKVLYVEIKDGTTSVPDDVEDWQGLVEGKGDNNGVELEDATEPEAVDVFSPTCPQREDSRVGNESAKALEIAWERVLLSSEEAVWNEGEAMVAVEVELEVVELL